MVAASWNFQRCLFLANAHTLQTQIDALAQNRCRFSPQNANAYHYDRCYQKKHRRFPQAHPITAIPPFSLLSPLVISFCISMKLAAESASSSAFAAEDHAERKEPFTHHEDVLG